MSFSKRSRTIKWFLKILKWTIGIIVVTIASISIWVYTGGIDRMMSKAVGQAYCKMTPGCVFEEYKLINGVYIREKYQNKTEIKEKKEKSVKKEKKTIDKKSEAYKAYLAQESRFTLNGCELTYNEQPFYIGMSLEEARKMFGKETHTYRSEFYRKNSKKYYWEDKGLALGIKDSKIWRMEIYLKQLDEQRYTKAKVIGNKYIIFNELFLSQTDKMREYIEKSNLNFDDFYVNGSGYNIS